MSTKLLLNFLLSNAPSGYERGRLQYKGVCQRVHKGKDNRSILKYYSPLGAFLTDNLTIRCRYMSHTFTAFTLKRRFVLYYKR